jgi:hypothetical protein
MSINQRQLSFKIIYYDEDLIQCEVVASNGRFAGATDLYTEADGEKLIDLAQRLKGFPKAITQKEELHFGFTEEEIAKLINEKIKPYDSYVGLRFYCYDLTGHPAVSITLREHSWTERKEAGGKVSFELKFDPAQLDEFIQDLIKMVEGKQGEAILNGQVP